MLSFDDLPYDVKGEIFTLCLPEDCLEPIQPNTGIAPMLLCHVCSSWRETALATTALWSHLHISLDTLWKGPRPSYGENTPAYQDKEAFLKWWKTNLGARPPILRVTKDARSLPPFQDNTDILCILFHVEDLLHEYIVSAQYIDADVVFPHLSRRELPNLHTLVSRNGFLRDYLSTSDAAAHLIPPTLRRLYLRRPNVLDGKPGTLLTNWSALTHLSLETGFISLATWFRILESSVNLQWGHFVISMHGKPSDYVAQRKLVMRSLVSLTVLQEFSAPWFPLMCLFQDLHLPALRTLGLPSLGISLHNSRAANDLRNVLASAPHVTSITLGGYQIDYMLQSPSLDFGSSAIPAYYSGTGNGTLPLSVAIPNLSQLNFIIEFPHEERARDEHAVALVFLQTLFRTETWLLSTNPRNTGLRIAIIIKTNSGHTESASVLKHWLKHHIKQFVLPESKISFDVSMTFRLRQDIGSDSVWRTWASSI